MVPVVSALMHVLMERQKHMPIMPPQAPVILVSAVLLSKIAIRQYPMVPAIQMAWLQIRADFQEATKPKCTHNTYIRFVDKAIHRALDIPAHHQMHAFTPLLEVM